MKKLLSNICNNEMIPGKIFQTTTIIAIYIYIYIAIYIYIIRYVST